MILEYGDMWSVFEKTDNFIITTNSFIRNDGRLVMGAGIAVQAKVRLSGIDKEFGEQIQHRSTYGLLRNKYRRSPSIYAFQVKINFYDNANIDLIYNATKQLMYRALYSNQYRFDLNFPGIGNGGLPKSAVLPILQRLPNNVHVWQFD